MKTSNRGNTKKFTETIAVMFIIKIGLQLEAIQLSDFASANIIELAEASICFEFSSKANLTLFSASIFLSGSGIASLTMSPINGASAVISGIM